MSIFAVMRLGRIAFYIITLITIGEVTNLSLQFRQGVMATFSADWMENPLEEDETLETEDEDDLICLSALQCPSIALQSIGAYYCGEAEIPEPLHSIIVPPPQA
jgi:hypothetical protein